MTIKATDGEGDGGDNGDSDKPFAGITSESFTDGKPDALKEQQSDESDDTEDSEADGDEESVDGDGAEGSDDSSEDEAGGDDSDSDEQADSDADGDEGEESESEDDEDVDPPPAKKSVSARMAELTSARRAAERERDELRTQLAAAKKGKQADTSDEDGDLTADDEAGKAAKRPEAKDYPYGEIDPKFIADLTDWQVDQKLAARDAKAAERQQREAGEQVAQKFVQDVDRTYEAGRKAFKDFQSKVIDAANKGEWDLTPETALMMTRSKVGHKIAYHLATNRGVAAEIAKLDPMDQARRIGRLEARFLEQSKQRTSPKPPKAKAMPTGVRGAGGKFSTGSDTRDFNAFEKMARAAEKITD